MKLGKSGALSVLIFMVSLSAAFATPSLQPVTLAELAGTWRTGCLAMGGTSEISTLIFTDRGEVTDQAKIFADAQCGAPYYTSSSQMDFSLNADQLSGAATPFDAAITFDSDLAVGQANQAPGACGISSWTLGVAQSVLDTSCGSRDTTSLQIGFVNPSTLEVTVCAPNGTECQSADYLRVN